MSRRGVQEKESKMIELIPCPFCGGDARVKSMSQIHVIMCTSCGSMGRIEASEQEAANAWNRRSQKMCADCARLFSIRLKAERKKRERSVEWMSKKLHMSKTTYYNFESGRMIPSKQDIAEIEKLLQIDSGKLEGQQNDIGGNHES